MVKKIIKPNNPFHQKLLDNLKLLLPCIEPANGYFMSDGALLGYIRENGFIKNDNDIDLMFLPGTKINMNKLKQSGLDYQDYYICGKVYDKKDNLYKVKNKWIEFLDYTRVLPEHEGFNRFELLKASKKLYEEEYIEPKFSEPFIDIFYLEELDNKYYVPYNFKNSHFTSYPCYINDSVIKRYKNMFYDCSVLIPYHTIDVLRMLYGPDWWKCQATLELNPNDPVIKVKKIC
tara:strand:- start:255 stop:950 length:696 start_codon:yes stop_codon:yes gene_type:complete